MEEVQRLEKLVTKLFERIDALEARIDELEKENHQLKAENIDLKKRLSRYETPKDSHNSHLPPSSDMPRSKSLRKTNSLREKSGKKPGGQAGHDGKTLTMSEYPDEIVFHSPNFCPYCSNDLTALEGEEIGRRQVIDIPPIRPIITEHRIIAKQCTCGRCIQGQFPQGVNSHTVYGENIHAWVAYLSVCQHIPYNRQQSMFADMLHIKLSQGTLYNILTRMKDRSDAAYEKIRQQIERSPVNGADETGANVNGKLHWTWVWQNALVSYFSVHESRGKKAIQEVFPNGLPQSVLSTDCWSPYFGIEVGNHQICTAHLLRELIYLKERYPEQDWAARFSALIKDALKLFKTGAFPVDTTKIFNRFKELLDETINKDFHKLVTFQNRIKKYKDYLFVFLANPDVPPDNNGSEKAVRQFKIKLKVSGFFKSLAGASLFAQILSICETAKKNGQSPFLALSAVAANYATE